jgi:hypothetical protein
MATFFRLLLGYMWDCFRSHERLKAEILILRPPFPSRAAFAFWGVGRSQYAASERLVGVTGLGELCLLSPDVAMHVAPRGVFILGKPSAHSNWCSALSETFPFAGAECEMPPNNKTSSSESVDA